MRDNSIALTDTKTEKRKNNFNKLWYKFSKSKLSVVGLIIVLAVVFLAIFAPFVTPYPNQAGSFVDFRNSGKGPSPEHWFGTDVVGRDILTRIIFALRGALTMGIVSLAIVVPIGVTAGLLAGYYAGTWADTLIMRITDIFLAIPPLILALAIAAMLEPTLTNSLMAISLAWWPWYARLVYGMASSIRNEPFIKAADFIGAGKAHVMFREMLPNFMAPILTKITLDMGWIILMGATLSFVGLGEQPPTPALGNMVSDGAKYLPEKWWISVFPALAIMVIILGFNLLGDGVRDMLSTEE